MIEVKVTLTADSALLAALQGLAGSKMVGSLFESTSTAEVPGQIEMATGAPQPVQMSAQPAAPVQTVPVQTVPVQTAPIAPVQQAAPVQQIQPAVQASVPTAAVEYDLPKLQLGAAQLMDAGKQADLLGLLQNQFGVQALTMLPKEQYGAFAAKLREMGAKL